MPRKCSIPENKIPTKQQDTHDRVVRLGQYFPMYKIFLFYFATLPAAQRLKH